jgi:hypothetical protein
MSFTGLLMTPLSGSRLELAVFLDHRLPALLQEAVDMYRTSGRQHGELGDELLDAEFCAAFRAYAGDAARSGTSNRRLNDVASEYVLRRRSAPIETVARDLVWFIELPGYEDRLPLVLLAFGRIMCIPALGMLLRLESDRHDDASQADFDWLLGLSTDRVPSA